MPCTFVFLLLPLGGIGQTAKNRLQRSLSLSHGAADRGIDSRAAAVAHGLDRPSFPPSSDRPRATTAVPPSTLAFYSAVSRPPFPLPAKNSPAALPSICLPLLLLHCLPQSAPPLFPLSGFPRFLLLFLVVCSTIPTVMLSTALHDILYVQHVRVCYALSGLHRRPAQFCAICVKSLPPSKKKYRELCAVGPVDIPRLN